MTDPTHCGECSDRIWLEESAAGVRWISTMNGPWCIGAKPHVPEEEINAEEEELRCDYDCSQCHPHREE